MSRLARHRVAVSAALLALFAGGFGVGYEVALGNSDARYAQFAPVRMVDRAAPLIAPLLSYRTPEATRTGQYGALKSSFQSIVAAATGSGDASRVSVYFRDLNTAAWLGVNQAETYYPASLLKVPVMIAYFKEAESDPGLLAAATAYDPSVMPDQAFDATSTLVAGRAYTNQELIEHMIIDSDNGATFTLLSRIDPTALSQVYTDLGIADPGDNSGSYQISTRTYGLFFRILYNATYLSPAYSEKALELLAQATFADGLVAGVPQGTTVAHKYGEHVLSPDGTTVQGVELSDCGITYYPQHPYLLCVMTSAKDMPSATGIIKAVSTAAYAAVGDRYPASTTPARI